jgi:amino acid transporter
MRQGAWGHLSNNATFYIIFSLLTLTLATVVNVVGLDVGKWLHNVGAIAMWIPAVIVIVMGAIAWHRFGSANAFTLHTLTPSIHFKDIIFWSLLVFAFGGCEAGSFLGGEILGVVQRGCSGPITAGRKWSMPATNGNRATAAR